MTGPQPMPSVRRRAIPGMASQRPGAPPPVTDTAPAATEQPSVSDGAAESVASPEPSPSVQESDTRRGREGYIAAEEPGRPGRHPAADYASTRLVNFRIPVDLHDRYRWLVREAEGRHPRLRHPSLTELVIALLEEGPATADEVAELIWRKRAAEHGGEL